MKTVTIKCRTCKKNLSAYGEVRGGTFMKFIPDCSHHIRDNKKTTIHKNKKIKR